MPKGDKEKLKADPEDGTTPVANLLLEALISAKRLKELFDGEKVTVSTKTAVFIPPHIINIIGDKAGYYLLAITDKIGQTIPLINQKGGLITIIVQKENGSNILPL